MHPIYVFVNTIRYYTLDCQANANLGARVSHLIGSLPPSKCKQVMHLMGSLIVIRSKQVLWSNFFASEIGLFEFFEQFFALAKEFSPLAWLGLAYSIGGEKG